jgi:hypothetical protein
MSVPVADNLRAKASIVDVWCDDYWHGRLSRHSDHGAVIGLVAHAFAAADLLERQEAENAELRKQLHVALHLLNPKEAHR